GAMVQDEAPSGTTITHWRANFFGAASGTTSGSGDMNQSVNIPAGDSIIYTIKVNVPASFGGDLTHTATVTPPSGTEDTDKSNNRATDTDYPKADLSITKTDGQTE